MESIDDIKQINGEIEDREAGDEGDGGDEVGNEAVLAQEGQHRRFVCEMPENLDKMKLIIAAMDDWFKERGIGTLGAKRAAVLEMAIDMLYAKPEIEKIVGKERLEELMAQEAKKFI